jgi:hypothetical protein
MGLRLTESLGRDTVIDKLGRRAHSAGHFQSQSPFGKLFRPSNPGRTNRAGQLGQDKLNRPRPVKEGEPVKTTGFGLKHREAVWSWWLALAMAAVLLMMATTASAQSSVFVPGTASGGFGYPIVDGVVPFVTAVAVSGPGTITVTYVSGTVNWAPGQPTGPNGVHWPYSGCALPLKASRGISHQSAPNIGALIGAFAPQSRVQKTGFSPVDGTKNAAPVGIMPGAVFFIGESRTITVTEAGTLFLGINDCEIGDNSGGFNVTVSTP